MTTTVAIARRRSVIDLRASAIRGSSLVVQQVVEGRVTDQEEDQIVEAEQPKPCTEAPVVRATRGEQDQVEPALLALRHKEAVDREQRREQQRRHQHPGRELPVELLAVEPEAEDDEGADGEEHHGGQRAQRAKLDPQVLAEKGRERRHPSSRTKSEASVAAPRSWLTTSRVRPSPAAIRGATRRRASGSRWASGSSRSSRSGSCSTARQMSIRCLIPAESSATRSRARAVMPTASSRSSVRGPASPASSPWSAAA